MKRIFAGVRRRFLSGALYIVYNPKDDRGRGRLCMLLSGIMTGLVGQLSGGLFYTGFLLEYGFNIVDIGIITFIPSLTSLLVIFSPMLLERFRRRKLLLAAGKLVYYITNILGITLLPTLVTDPEARLLWFIVIIVVSNSINALFAPGYSAWQVNFLPDNVRMDYFSSSGCINSFISYLITLGVSYLTDRLKGSPEQLEMITLLRYIAFALAVVDCLIQLIPKEYPYLTRAKAKLSNTFILPLRNRRYLLTILMLAAYTFVTNLPNATLNTYVLEIGVSYTLSNGINALYFLFFIFFTPMWKRFIAKHYWFRAFALAMMMQMVTYIMYVFVTPDTIWLYVVVRLSQHVFGVMMNSTVASLPYVNLPEEDRTSYLSFYTIVNSVAAFVSMMLGTLYTKITGGAQSSLTALFHLFGMPVTSTQILLFFCAAGQLAVSLLILLFATKMTPPDHLPTPKTAEKA